MEQATTDKERVIAFRRDIKVLLCTRIREAIQMVLEEELDEALGCGRYERGGSRLGFRHGWVERRVTTPNGPETLLSSRRHKPYAATVPGRAWSEI